MVEIKGIEKFSSRDFPGHISSTVFLGGCTFRCPYCHNADLVLRPETIQTMPIDIFLSYLDGRKGWLEAVCFTGGEPLLHEEVEDLVRVVRERGLLVKLDTNGSFPERLEGLLAAGLLDWVAMDVKAPLERYREVTRSNVDVESIVRSADILRNSGARHTFRTTVVPGLVGKEDVVKIGEWLNGAADYLIQQFVPQTTIDPAFLEVKPFSRAELEDIVAAAKPYFQEARVEGPE
ncbi:MAG: anaerobic ribonucleoside-triphosphate reductase activating protein [Candidatus Aminicenantes bacterium]|nr:anaerobic ribonucleoside-triphosphate reductase activating protein [Candidatus Aminicenantes bacterium]MCJ7486145.1 anaerobic ribonucleoside-triphosphate reductase activating protein [Candidatus Aminicenantes bacterium]TFG57884.1 MAG: anaerobic ribonucleoside-triphosphate reductase activating protein [Candidatus Aminicenantes bacterium]